MSNEYVFGTCHQRTQELIDTMAKHYECSRSGVIRRGLCVLREAMIAEQAGGYIASIQKDTESRIIIPKGDI